MWWIKFLSSWWSLFRSWEQKTVVSVWRLLWAEGTSHNNTRTRADLINPTTNWISVWKWVYWNNTRPDFTPTSPCARHRLLIQPPLHQTADGLLYFLLFSPKGSLSCFWICLSRPAVPPVCSSPPADLIPPTRPPDPPPYQGAANQPSCPVPLTPRCCSVPRSPLCIWINFPEGEWAWHQVRWVFVVLPAADAHFTLLISCNEISFVMNKSRATITLPCNLSNLLF